MVLSKLLDIKFHQVMLKDGFTMMKEDYCVYLKGSINSLIALSLYIGDILIVENNKEMINTTKWWLSTNLE